MPSKSTAASRGSLSRIFATRGRKIGAILGAAFVARLGGGIAALVLRTAESTTKKALADPEGAPIQIRVASPGSFRPAHVFAPYYVVPRERVPSPDALPEAERSNPETFSDFGWAERTGAVAGSPQIVRLQLRTKGDEPVTVNSLRVNAVERRPPLQGWFVANPACGADIVRLARVDLDGVPRPTVEFLDAEGSERRLTLFVTRTDVETIEIHASTRTSMVDWTAEIFFSGPDGDGSIVVDDRGEPFRVTSETASEGYRPQFAEQGQTIAREPGWDEGISAC